MKLCISSQCYWFLVLVPAPLLNPLLVLLRPLTLLLVPPLLCAGGTTRVCSSFTLPLTATTLTIPGWWNSLFKFMQMLNSLSLTLPPLFTCLTIGYLMVLRTSNLKRTILPSCWIKQYFHNELFSLKFSRSFKCSITQLYGFLEFSPSYAAETFILGNFMQEILYPAPLLLQSSFPPV